MSEFDARAPLAVARRAQLLDALQREGTVRVGELTELLGVTTATVRRDIAQLAREGLVRKVHGGAALVSADDPVAEHDAPASAESGTAGYVGMLVPSIDYYWPEVARGAEEEAKAHGMRVMLRGSSYETTDEQPQLARLVRQPGVRGLVIAPSMSAPTAASTVAWLASLPLPVVLVERAAVVEPHHAVMESVVSDHALGAAMAVRHLASLGHRRVGLVLGHGSPTSPHIRRGWLEAAIECGFSPDSTIDVDIPDARSGKWDNALDAALDACLSSGTTALLVHADAAAMAIVQRLEERGVSVPGKFSVVAYDDEVAGMFTPPLTAVRPPRASVGRAAVGLVAARLADPGRPTHRVVLSPTLRVRDSTAPPPAPR
jgi:DNA-binding LacI/PurR family transcriptional regulator